MPTALNTEDIADLIREPEIYSTFLNVFVCLDIHSPVKRDKGGSFLVCPFKNSITYSSFCFLLCFSLSAQSYKYPFKIIFEIYDVIF